MNKFRYLAFAAVLFALLSLSQSQAYAQAVPTTISYQGHIQVNGVPYNGTGYFKFVLVNGAGDAAYWSNDGTGLATPPFEPTGNVVVPVTNGYFAAQLGATNPLTTGIFITADRYLRIWFSTDAVTFEQLAPDTALASVPYALTAGNVDWSDVLNPPATVTPMPTATPMSTATPQPTATPMTLQAPVTISVSTENTTGVTTHTHALVSSSNPGATTSILATNSGGVFTVTGLNSDSGAVYIGSYPVSGYSQIYATGNLLFKVSSGKIMVFGGGTSVQFDNFPYEYPAQGIVWANKAQLANQAAGINYLIVPGVSLQVSQYTGLTTTADLQRWNNYTGTTMLRISSDFNFIPGVSETLNLGSSAMWWNEVHYHTLVSHSLGQFNGGVLMQDGRRLTCSDAIAALRSTGSTMGNGLLHLDYSTIPVAAYIAPKDEVWTGIITGTRVPELTSSQQLVRASPVYNSDGYLLYNEYTIQETIKGMPGVDLDAMTSLMLCAQGEFDVRLKALEAQVKP